MVYKLEQNRPNDKYLTYDQINILNAFQKLWQSIANLLEVYIKASIYDTRNQKAASNNLYNIPSKFYHTFSIFYGTQNAQKFMDHMFDFLKSAVGVVEAIKNGDYILTSSRIIEWYQHADEMAEFLADLNVFWDETQWKYLLYQYIKLQIDEINELKNDNYDKEIETKGKITDSIYLIADYMARGIILANMQQSSN